MTKHTNVEEYLATCSEIGRERLLAIREIVLERAPGARETISYDIPTFTVGGKPLAHMAAWKQHVSIYPVPDGDDEFQALIAPYVTGKGTLTFRHRDPLPLEVIDRLVEARVRQHRT